jgi:hypothetical protein
VASSRAPLFAWRTVRRRKLILETLFDMRVALYEIHDVLIEPEDADEEAEEDT